MIGWSELAGVAPEIAEVGARLLAQHNLAYLATVRADGGPRVHPVAPFVIDGGLYVASPRTSPKARDQHRDGRYAMHMLPGKDDDEFVIRGRVRPVEDAAERARIIEAGPHWVKADDCIFEYRIERAATTWWENVGQPGTRPVRRRFEV